jgi:predicted  nucleic acid-binding Zn-ribbon protein
MSTISLLVELQNMDMRSDENAHVRATLQKSLADSSKLDAARAEMETTDAQSAALQAKLRALELETGGLTDKLKQVNEKLYSGRVTNPKELAGLSQDQEMLARRKSELEDRALTLMEQIEKAENVAEAKRAAHEKIAAQVNAQRDRDRAVLRDLDAADAELAQKRATVRAQIDAAALRVYDNLRVTKKGRAVALIKNGSCSVCGYAIPSGLISRVKAGNELVFCTNCERILAP